MKKTNKYIKHIKRLSIMIVTLLLSFTLLSGEVHAYLQTSPIYYGKLTQDQYQISNDGLAFTNRLRFDYYSSETGGLPHSNYDVSEYNLKHILNTFIAYSNDSNSPLYTVNQFIFKTTHYLVTVRAGEIYDEIGTVYAIRFNTEGESVDFLDSNDYVISNITKTLLESTADVFMLRTFRYFDDNLNYAQGVRDGYDSGRSAYGYFDGSLWRTATVFGASEYTRGEGDGYQLGLQANTQDIYDEAYNKGSNDSFMASIKDWIVPAIIVVLFLGGAISIIVKKREG